MKIFLLFYMCDFAVGLTHCYKTTVFLHLYGLSNGAIFTDLERPLTWFLRSRHCLTLNISEMAKHTAIVTMEGE